MELVSVPAEDTNQTLLYSMSVLFRSNVKGKWYVLLNWKRLALAMDLSYAGHTVVHAELNTSVTSLTKR